MYNDLILCCQVDVACRFQVNVQVGGLYLGIDQSVSVGHLDCNSLTDSRTSRVCVTGHLMSLDIYMDSTHLDIWPLEDHLDTTVLLKNRFMFKYDNNNDFNFIS